MNHWLVTLPIDTNNLFVNLNNLNMDLMVVDSQVFFPMDTEDTVIISPMNTVDSYWVFHGYFQEPIPDCGKWMLFYPSNQLDYKWKQYCELWDTGNLPGIIGMKCSTALEKPNRFYSTDGVIILYCSYSTVQDYILRIGRALLPYLEDYSFPNIFYKSDIQTMNGKVKKNYLYHLPTAFSQRNV